MWCLIEIENPCRTLAYHNALWGLLKIQITHLHYLNTSCILYHVSRIVLICHTQAPMHASLHAYAYAHFTTEHTHIHACTHFQNSSTYICGRYVRSCSSTYIYHVMQFMQYIESFQYECIVIVFLEIFILHTSILCNVITTPSCRSKLLQIDCSLLL